jgi:uncharacterized protein
VGAIATPVPPAKRIDSIDALRGLALFGVLAINLETEFRVSIFQQFLRRPEEQGLDHWIGAFLEVFVDLKAFAVFSLLFGIGLAIQYERLDGDPRRLVLLVRRLLALMVFGLIHLFLIWNGDILAEYAVAGLIVLPFLFGSKRVLALGAAFFLLLYLAMPLLPTVVAFPDSQGLANHVRAAERIYGTGRFDQILAFRIEEARALLPLHIFIFPRTVGLFLLGALAWGTGLVRNANRHASWLWLAGALAVGLGLALTLASSRAYSGWPSLGPLTVVAFPLGTIVLALGYASLVVGASTGSHSRLLAWAEPVGRMAFTNYVVQSLILGWIFYGYGLGWFGKIGLSAGLCLVFAIYIGQALFSRWWLKRFRYGPLEWLWRALMYGRAPPFRTAPLGQSSVGSPG